MPETQTNDKSDELNKSCIDNFQKLRQLLITNPKIVYQEQSIFDLISHQIYSSIIDFNTSTFVTCHYNEILRIN